MNKLESYSERVRSGRDFDAAIEFARFVLNSGILLVLRSHNQSGVHKVDSALLCHTATELQRMVCDAYRTGQATPRTKDAQLERIQHSLDLIAGHVAKLSPTSAASSTAFPNLSVVEAITAEGDTGKRVA